MAKSANRLLVAILCHSIAYLRSPVVFAACSTATVGKVFSFGVTTQYAHHCDFVYVCQCSKSLIA